ncbi:hypothetical protein KM043_002530 [Ampulex compressa]|nr:hypothetical protein KM043_002530 [Ampulex compressa]
MGKLREDYEGRRTLSCSAKPGDAFESERQRSSSWPPGADPSTAARLGEAAKEQEAIPICPSSLATLLDERAARKGSPRALRMPGGHEGYEAPSATGFTAVAGHRLRAFATVYRRSRAPSSRLCPDPVTPDPPRPLAGCDRRMCRVRVLAGSKPRFVLGLRQREDRARRERRRDGSRRAPIGSDALERVKALSRLAWPIAPTLPGGFLGRRTFGEAAFGRPPGALEVWI